MSKKELKRIRVANQVRNPLIESIKLSNNILMHIQYHNDRLNAARKVLFGVSEGLFLEKEIAIPENLSEGVYKCRVTYREGIENVEFEEYILRPIRSLKLVECNDIEYNYKYADRSKINELNSRKDDCDDVLIVKNGLITDTSIANVAFLDETGWVTPSSPLLAGTTRARLMNEKSIHEAEIRIEDLQRFDKIRIFNSMMDVHSDLKSFRIVS